MRRDLRLRSPALFADVYERGKRIGERDLILFHLDSGGAPTRVGFSVSKKVGKAATRNKIKRRLRNIINGVEDQLKPGHDLVFVARPSIASTSFGELRESVGQLLRQAGVLKEHP